MSLVKKIAVGGAILLVLWAINEPAGAGDFVSNAIAGGKDALGNFAVFLSNVFG